MKGENQIRLCGEPLQSAIAEQQWTKRHPTLQGDAIACLSFLAAFANGRTQFDLRLGEMLAMTRACSADRFLGLCRTLEVEGLIAVRRDWRRDEDLLKIKIIERPPWPALKLAAGERFNLPHFANTKQQGKRVPSPELAAFAGAQRKCARRGVAFPYADFAQFLAAVGPRPEGKFQSGGSTHALFRRDDGRYEWREKTTRTRSQEQNENGESDDS